MISDWSPIRIVLFGNILLYLEVRIAFGNFGKFSIEGPVNRDYAKDRGRLMSSIDYVRTDLSFLKPDIIIMPATIYRTIGNAFDAIKGPANVIPIYQINTRVINCAMKKYEKKSMEELENITEWYERLGRKFRDRYLKVFTYLDKVLSEYNGV